MKFSISIPFYLWRNTFKRWFEYPVSPLCKMFIPCLLGFLSIAVLALFAHLESELRHRLDGSSIYKVYVSEMIPPEDAPTALRSSLKDEVFWVGRYGEAVKVLRQPLASAIWGFEKSIPIYAYGISVAEPGESRFQTDHPLVWLTTEREMPYAHPERISMMGRNVMATVAPMPLSIRELVKLEHAVLAPVELLEPILHRGFGQHILVDLQSMQDVRSFVSEASAYYKAEGRKVRIISSIDILDDIENITALQRVVRSVIMLGCGFILALTVGSVAWLEYRQDTYLIALLKSFGTPGILLLGHMFMENLIIVVSGVFIAVVAWPSVFAMIAKHMPMMNSYSPGSNSVATADVATIMMAAIIGVVFAMLPVAFGINRRAGLVLQ